jgi:thiamine-phosphate pyrophosphorylase
VIRCLVTDRRRLCGESAVFDEVRRRLLQQVREAVDAGVDLIQLREGDLPAAALADLARDFVAAARGTATRVLVNDRLDVALACGAGGVHLRADSMGADAVRRIAPPGFLVTRSVHRADEAARAGAVDYLVAGTVFASLSKPAGASLLGVDGLAAIVRAAGVPVLAIGGITTERIEAVRRAGAAGIAGIGLFVESSGRM